VGGRSDWGSDLVEAETLIGKRLAARRYSRKPGPALIVLADGARFFRCEVCNISGTGAKLATPDAQDVPNSFFLRLAIDGMMHRHCQVVWRSAEELGIQFSSMNVFPLHHFRRSPIRTRSA
jgi:hypothetical protein